MQKPGLGRGLGGLLASSQRDIPAGPTPGPDGARPSGVDRLLHGEAGPGEASEAPRSNPAPPSSVPAPGPLAGTVVQPQSAPPVLPSWVLGCLLLADLVLVVVAAWVALASRAPGRLVVATLLVALGGSLLSLGVRLRGARGVAELRSLNPFEEPRHRVRVQFLDPKR